MLFEDLIRPFAWLACLAAPHPAAADTSLPAPVPRIERTFETADAEPKIFTTATALIHPEITYSARIKRWASVHFWDVAGDGPATVRILEGSEIVEGESFAHDNRIYLGVPRGVRIVDRDPAVPLRYFPLPTDWSLVAVNADHLILARTGYRVSDPGRLRFVRTSDLGTAGEAEASGLKITRVIAREDGMIISGEKEQNSGLVLGSTRYPRLVAGKISRFKVSQVPGAIYGLQHFGRNFAVVTSASSGQLRVVAWDIGRAASSIPLMGTKAGYGWAEAAGELYLRYPLDRISRIVTGKSSATLEPIALPAGLQGYALVNTTSPSLYLTAHNDRPGFLRLHPGNGRQLEVTAPVARESDGVMRFVARLDAPASHPVSFHYETRPRGAEAGVDYHPVEGTVTLASGETEAVIEVPLAEDFTIEGPESLEFHLTGCSGAWCDRAVTTGRIIGSGARLIARETIPWEVSRDFGDSRSPETPHLDFPSGSAVAGQLGFQTFAPLEGNHGRYFYAQGIALSDGGKWCCQFDAQTGELLDILPNYDPSRWKIEEDELLLWNGTNYDRWGFFDGFPAPSFSGKPLRENGGPQGILALSERCHLPLEFEAGGPESDAVTGPLAMTLKSDGELELTANPPDDPRVHLKRSVGVPLLARNLESGAVSSMRVTIGLTDDDFAYTTRIPAGPVDVIALAARGNRLWTGSNQASALSGYEFRSGGLAADAAIALPKNAALIHSNGLMLSFDGTAFAAGMASKGKAALWSLQSEDPGAKGSLRRAAAVPSALLLAGPYLAVGESRYFDGQPGQVRILDSVTGKLLKVLTPPDPAPGFGHSLASGGGMLWVGCPPAGTPVGRVFGYSLEDFSLVRTLHSPQPIVGSAFGISLAADDQQLVIGDPGNWTQESIWVFDAQGTGLLKRLSLAPETNVYGLGLQVDTRGGRILARCGPADSRLQASAAASPVMARGREPRTSIDSPWGWSRSVNRVVLWSGLDAAPLHLHSVLEGSNNFGSGFQIVLLDDCAVYTSMADGPANKAGLQVYVFPEAAAAKKSLASAAAGTGSGTPVWPTAGAAAPRWSFQNPGREVLKVTVDLGAAPLSADDLRIEWSADLRAWIPLKAWSDTPAAPALDLSWPTKDRPKGFFRLRAAGE